VEIGLPQILLLVALSQVRRLHEEFRTAVVIFNRKGCWCWWILENDVQFLFLLLQYIPHAAPLLSTAFERFAVIMSIALIWLYAFFLTVGGAYKNAAPKTQFHCRTDRSGLVGGAPW
jgi:hypothetical protein